MGSQVALQRAQAAMIEVVGEHENICESKDENAELLQKKRCRKLQQDRKRLSPSPL